MPPCLSESYLYISSYVCLDLSVNKVSVLFGKLETPIRNWVDEDVLFYDEYDTNFLRY